MYSIATLGALVILLLAVFSQSFRLRNNTGTSQPNENLLGSSSQPILTPTLAPTETQQATRAITPTDDFTFFRYPDSSIVAEDGETTHLETRDDPKRITDWYKEKITSSGMNTKSFVQTKTNGEVFNTLVGSDGKKEIRVEIRKPKKDPVVKIILSIQTP